jgi:hypothetical protein
MLLFCIVLVGFNVTIKTKSFRTIINHDKEQCWKMVRD